MSVKWYGDSAVELTDKLPTTGRVGTRLLYRDDEVSLEVVEHGLPWSFDADGQLFRLVSEAQRKVVRGEAGHARSFAAQCDPGSHRVRKDRSAVHRPERRARRELPPGQRDRRLLRPHEDGPDVGPRLQRRGLSSRPQGRTAPEIPMCPGIPPPSRRNTGPPLPIDGFSGKSGTGWLPRAGLEPVHGLEGASTTEPFGERPGSQRIGRHLGILS